MDNLLHHYIEKGFHDPAQGFISSQNPVVTISREYGCPSKLIGQMLTEHLNKFPAKLKEPRWKLISKEIVEESARKLEMNPHDVRNLINSGQKGLLEDILVSFSHPYVNNIRIRKTIQTVITTFAQEGHVILVGRGAAAILLNHPKSLHVRLHAPLEWRAEDVAKRKGISQKTAERLVTDMDKKRMELFEMILGRKFDISLFDISFNCKTLPAEEIVRDITRIMEYRQMV